ncbi:MAG: tryptophan synthase subunit beta [Rickettsiales bacterium]
MRYAVDEHGFYGEFGGDFIPEMLRPNILELQRRYVEITDDPDFRQELGTLLRDYTGRPSPLYFASRLSERYGNRIYLKREDLNHTGSHKINNAVGQLLLAKRLGKTRIIAETGAGQHGVATASACALFGLDCTVYMGEVDTKRQSPNVKLMEYLGAKVVPVSTGTATLKDATNEALRDWIANPAETHYVIGSAVGPHPFPDMVMRFQRVIGDEIARQVQEQTDRSLPDAIIACVGGGSNAIGAFAAFLDDASVKLIGVEAGGEGVESERHAAALAKGSPGVMHGSKMLLLQTADGQVKDSYSVSAGLSYPGVGPFHAFLKTCGRARYGTVTDEEALNAAQLLALTEGIVPAVESAHALAYLEHMERGKDAIIVVNLSGSGRKDMDALLAHREKRLREPAA